MVKEWNLSQNGGRWRLYAPCRKKRAARRQTRRRRFAVRWAWHENPYSGLEA